MKVTSSMFEAAWKAAESESFVHRKVDKKEYDTFTFPKAVLTALKKQGVITKESGPRNTAKQNFEEICFRTLFPDGVPVRKNGADADVTKVTSQLLDRAFPKDRHLGEFSTHPVGRKVVKTGVKTLPDGTEEPVWEIQEYYFKPLKKGEKREGYRAAPRPTGRGGKDFLAEVLKELPQEEAESLQKARTPEGLSLASVETIEKLLQLEAKAAELEEESKKKASAPKPLKGEALRAAAAARLAELQK